MPEQKAGFSDLTLIPEHYIAARVDAYHAAGLEAQFHALWGEGGEAVAAATRRHWEHIFATRPHHANLTPSQREARIEKAIADMRMRLSAPIDALWVARLA